MAKFASKSQPDESAQALKHIVGEDPLDRVYLFYGEDDFIIERLIKAIQDKRFKGGEPDPLSWEVFRAGDGDGIARRAVEAVRTISMFGGLKAVVLREAEKLCEADLAIISDYAKSPMRALLIIAASKIDARRKSWAEIKKNAYAVSCAPLAERCTADYIRSAARARKLNMDNDAVDVLSNLIGSSRSMIERALEKLIVALGSRADTIVSPAFVEEHVVDTRERSIFELTKAISERTIPQAINALNALLEQKQEPVAINGMIARQARMMLQVKLGLAKRMSEADIGAKIGANPYAMREYLQGVKNYTLTELFKFHAAVFDADKALKSSPVPNDLILSRLLLSLIR